MKTLILLWTICLTAFVALAAPSDLDPTFGGGDGSARVDFNNNNDTKNAMALDGQGRAVVVGESNGAIALAPELPSRTITVTNTNDSGPGSLRQAIADAASGDTINFSITGSITLTSGQLEILRNLTIQGPGANLLSINGNDTSRVFSISAGVTAVLDGLTITNGWEPVFPISFGGGIFNQGVLSVSNCNITGNGGFSGDITTSGGGIFNDTSGTLNLSDSTVSGNFAADFNGNSNGGGITNGGVMTVTDTTIADNASTFAAGIYNYGTLTVANSTISLNILTFEGLGGVGGGIYNSGTLTITNSTISGNTAPGGGGISAVGSETLQNTIIAGNSFDDIRWTIETASHNLIGDANSSGGIQHGVNGNIVGFSPLLGPLQNNGGPTMTHALLTGSPAINAGDTCVLVENGCGFTHPALETDQRGFPRIGNVDMGAFESGVWPCNSRRRIGFPVPNCGG
jgi:hypothetical protein